MEPWNLAVGESQNILKKLAVNPNFGEYFSLAQGTGTRADAVFFVKKISEDPKYFKIFSKETQSEHLIEKNLIKPSAKGKDVESYELKDKNQLLIFPYVGKKLIDKSIIEHQNPCLWKYVEAR